MECKICLFDTKNTDAVLDEEGVCNYCHLYQQMEREYSLENGSEKLELIVNEIKSCKKFGQKYDCIIGVSGGIDSTFLLYTMVKKYDLKPLAVHFDNGWNTAIATNNMKSICRAMDVDLEIYSVDNDEFDDIIMSFLKAGVLDIDAPTDIGLITTLYQKADEYNINYIIEGHSFRTEGVQPLNWAYVDGKYIYDIHKKFGTKKMVTYPNLWISKFVKWTAIKKIKRIRPLYYIDYNKNKVREMLRDYGFIDYNGHHHENKWSAFNYSYYLPKRAQIDGRLNEICSYLRRGLITKDDACVILKEPVEYNQEIIYEILQRLNMSQSDLDCLMDQPIKTWHEFKTYKCVFHKTKLIWYSLYKAGIVPKSFYVKYCK